MLTKSRPTAPGLLFRADRSNGSSGDRTRCVTACRRRHRRQPPQAAAGNDSSSTAGQPRSSGEQWGSSFSRRRPGGSGGGAGAPVGGSLFAKQQQQQTPPQPSPPAAEQQQPQLDPALAASIRASVERAASTLDDIVREVLDELLLEEASAYLLENEQGNENDEQQQQALAQHNARLHAAARGAVVKRLEWLDGNFLAALNAALSTPTAMGTPELGMLLGAVRAEVLDLVGARLPPPVRVLNAALQHARRAGRRGIIATALAGGGGDVPAASLDELGAAVAQLVDDMEEQQVVANRALLARLVLLREELRERAAAEEAGADFLTATAAGAGAAGAAAMAGKASGSGATFFGFHRANLPARCAAFAKSLLSSGDRTQRLGLLTRAFEEDWLAERPAPAPAPAPAGATISSSDVAATSAEQQQGKRSGMRDVRLPPAGDEQQQGEEEAPDAVRPGRFLATLAAMRNELEGRLVGAGLQDEEGAGTLTLLRRLEDVRLESLAALDRLQRGLGAGGVSGGGGGGVMTVAGDTDEGELDYELELTAQYAGVPSSGGAAAAAGAEN